MASLIFYALFFALSAVILPCHIQAEKSDTVAVAVYYESLCPDSRAFFFKQLPSTYKELKSRIELSLIPFGNAVVSGEPGAWTFRCQHGQDECYGNIAQTCAISIMNGTDDSLKFITCAFNHMKQSDIIKQCIEEENLRVKIDVCANGERGKDLEREMGLKTNALNPSQTFIPWITINGKGSNYINERANDNLFKLVCESFQSDIPAPCTSEKKRVRKGNFYRTLAGL